MAVKNKKFKEREIIEIFWIDSIYNSGWEKKNDFLKKNGDLDWIYHKTIGYFLCDDKVSITVIQSITDTEKEDYNIHASMSIPKAAINKIRRLK